jgi:hypothetical protein
MFEGLRAFPTPTVTCGKSHVCYMYYRRVCKAMKLTVHLGSVFS